jgi:hypothetical protein
MSANFEDKYLLHVHKELDVDASPENTFDAILEQIGPGFDTPDGRTQPLKLEPWPGGRWYRDLGNNTGHLWAHVQVIKPPFLLELVGPMFMSYAVASHVQYRITKKDRGCHLEITHRAIGEISPNHRAGVQMGWEHILKCIGTRASN